MVFTDWREAEEYFAKKENVIEWFADNGITIKEKKAKGFLYLSKFKWVEGILFCEISGDDNSWEPIKKTGYKKLDAFETHYQADDNKINTIHGSFDRAYNSYIAKFADISSIMKDNTTFCQPADGAFTPFNIDEELREGASYYDTLYDFKRSIAKAMNIAYSDVILHPSKGPQYSFKIKENGENKIIELTNENLHKGFANLEGNRQKFKYFEYPNESCNILVRFKKLPKDILNDNEAA